MCVPVAKITAEDNRIEGRLLPGQKVVVVEDLISTGGSAIEVVEALQRGRRGGAWHRQHFYLWYGKRSGSTRRLRM